MEEKLNIILLKPRFKIPLNQDEQQVLQKFEEKLNAQNCSYESKMGNNHVFIDIPKVQQKIWSPQLELVVEPSENGSFLKGFFAPKPSFWTFFIFLHFIVGIGFMIFSALAYANYVSKNSYKVWVGLMFFSVLIWFFLYILGQIGKIKAKSQMEELKTFLKNCLNELEIQ